MTARTNLDTLVTVFGASGFLGRHIVRTLARKDFRIRAAGRRPDLMGHLQPLGRVGQIQPVQANIRFPASVEAAVRGASIVVNLAGILAESGRQSFDGVHARGAETVARAAAAAGATLIHVSALGADPRSPSHYARSKAAGEAAVLAAVADTVILRPSIVFGPEDAFFNRFAALARMLPALPLIGGGETRFQPVFVGDVADAVALAADGKAAPGVYELGGPDITSFRELMQYVLATIERRRLLVPIPFGLARLQAELLQYLPGAPLTPDQVELLRTDNVVSEAALRDGRCFAGLGIEPTAIGAIVPSYLWRFRKTGQFRSSAA